MAHARCALESAFTSLTEKAIVAQSGKTATGLPKRGCAALQKSSALTELHLARPHHLGRVRHDPLGEVALDAADHVVILRFAAFADDAEGVVLQC